MKQERRRGAGAAARRPVIRVKRAYEEPASDDGVRFLVDRLWPRGVTKDALRLDAWLRDAAPSDALRRWFGHDPRKWDEFRRRYRAELDANPSAWEPIARAMRAGKTVTLVFGARDTGHNDAVALRAYLAAKRPGRRAGYAASGSRTPSRSRSAPRRSE